jgi:site-specific recombinase XerD
MSCSESQHRHGGGVADDWHTRVYQRTGDLYLVQAALRHRSITSTVVYATVNESQLRRAMEG